MTTFVKIVYIKNCIPREIMKKNGTAVDVAIAVLVCNGAVHAHASGIGGGFFMTIYIKSEEKSYFLNARDVAPLDSHKDMYENNIKASEVGPLSIAIPGEVKGYFEAKKRFGNKDISMLELFEPTIKLCEEGFKVTKNLADVLQTPNFSPMSPNNKLNKVLRYFKIQKHGYEF